MLYTPLTFVSCKIAEMYVPRSDSALKPSPPDRDPFSSCNAVLLIEKDSNNQMY